MKQTNTIKLLENECYISRKHMPLSIDYWLILAKQFSKSSASCSLLFTFIFHIPITLHWFSTVWTFSYSFKFDNSHSHYFPFFYFKDFPITFKDGMIGVNFGGYHAEAGLGGLLTGNAAHGGLIASAGTPSGQSAVAGLGGNSGRKWI